MNNTSIYFYPKRNIIASNPPTDELYEIKLTLDMFNESKDESQTFKTTMSGIVRGVEYYSVGQWSVSSFVDPVDSEQATTEECKMFFESTRLAEAFQIYDVDNEILIDVIRQGSWSKNREIAEDKNLFGYSFNIRESVSA